jgi:hypothetical protein
MWEVAQCQHRFYSGKSLQRRSPARELEPTAMGRLGIDTGGTGEK